MLKFLSRLAYDVRSDFGLLVLNCRCCDVPFCDRNSHRQWESTAKTKMKEKTKKNRRKICSNDYRISFTPMCNLTVIYIANASGKMMNHRLFILDSRFYFDDIVIRCNSHRLCLICKLFFCLFRHLRTILSLPATNSYLFTIAPLAFVHFNWLTEIFISWLNGKENTAMSGYSSMNFLFLFFSFDINVSLS